MITFINRGKYNDYFGLSTDTKPLDAPNASRFYEMDKSARWMFDKANIVWRQQASSGGGGGGGGGDDPHPTYGSVTFTANWEGNGPYTQVVTIAGYTVTANTKIDLLADNATIEQMVTDGVDEIYIVNDNTVLTAYAVSGKPSTAMTVQAIFSEVN